MAFFKKSESGQDAERQERQPENETIEALRRQATEAHLPEAPRNALNKELDRLLRLDPSFPEYAIGLNYAEFLLSLPWRKSTADNLDLARAEAELRRRHDGLETVKERVLEHLATAIMRQRRPLSVLAVDDEPIARENMAHALTKDGHTVHTAADGVEALKLLDEHDFDVAVSDLKMENMDGMELLDRFQEASPATDFIIVTGYASVETAVEAMRKGAAQYLAKPLNLDLLRRTVRETAAAKRRVGLGRGPVLCFSGPPGTGKTSIGQSIAQALGRRFVRLSMSGMRDEAELKGHRRTYVGAMPGRILSELRRVESNNPVFMLDEVDKASQGFRGDPVAVLLELLDPEQHQNFLDYYVDVPFDLSGVLFITTANVVEDLPRPVLDRMEVIPFSSYTSLEKRRIAAAHLVPRQLDAAGLAAAQVAFTDEALGLVVDGYAREAGLRNLERVIGSMCRKLDRQILQGGRKLPATVDEAGVEELLGPPPYRDDPLPAEVPPGLALGLVWTENGGHVLPVEAAVMRGGAGKLTMTGSLGRVLRESAQTGLSWIRGHAETYGVDPELFRSLDLHVHIPAGAVPKDGPSAGVTIAAALLSAVTGRPLRRGTAMTGEVTLTGRVMRVSGLREKLLAAGQCGVDRVIAPKGNEFEVMSLDEEVRRGLDIYFVEGLDEALELAGVTKE